MFAPELAGPGEMDCFFEQMMEQIPDSERVMEIMQMTRQQLAHHFRSTGKVYTVTWHGEKAGFYWIEQRDRVLHLHGIVLLEPFQNMGIGTRILDLLEAELRLTVDIIELGVHMANPRAIDFYRRAGFQTVRKLEDLGFLVMQKELHGAAGS